MLPPSLCLKLVLVSHMNQVLDLREPGEPRDKMKGIHSPYIFIQMRSSVTQTYIIAHKPVVFNLDAMVPLGAMGTTGEC